MPDPFSLYPASRYSDETLAALFTRGHAGYDTPVTLDATAGRLDPGYYRLEWDGTDGEGHASGSGVFVARLLVEGRIVVNRRFVMLR